MTKYAQLYVTEMEKCASKSMPIREIIKILSGKGAHKFTFPNTKNKALQYLGGVGETLTGAPLFIQRLMGRNSNLPRRGKVDPKELKVNEALEMLNLRLNRLASGGKGVGATGSLKRSGTTSGVLGKVTPVAVAGGGIAQIPGMISSEGAEE